MQIRSFLTHPRKFPTSAVDIFPLEKLYPSTLLLNAVRDHIPTYSKITGNYYDFENYFYQESLPDITFLQKESTFFRVYTSSTPAPLLIGFFNLFTSFLYKFFMFFILFFNKSSLGISNPDSVRFLIKPQIYGL